MQITCPESGQVEVATHDGSALGEIGVLAVTDRGVALLVGSKPIAEVTGRAAARLVRCLGVGYTYYGELGENDGGATVIRYWMA